MAIIKIKFKNLAENAELHGEWNNILNIVKSCTNRKYCSENKYWEIEFNQINLDILKPYLFNYDYYKSILIKNTNFDESKYPFLYKFQQEGVKLLLNGRVLLADSVGSGKTIQTITYCIVSNFKNILIVCPSPLKRLWKDEIYKFFKEESIFLEGPLKKRKEQYDVYIKNNYRFLIVNYEQLRASNDFLINRKWDCIVLDEVHRAKNSKTKSYKIINKMDVDKKIGLSARPQENDLGEIYNIIQLLTNRSFMKWKDFSDNHYIYGEIYVAGGHGETMTVKVGYKNLEEFHHKLKPLMIMRKRNEVLEDMPERTIEDIYINLNQHEQEIHNNFLYNVAHINDDEDRKNILANLTFARETCDSLKLVEINSDIEESKKSSKLNALNDILSDISDKVVIFTQWARMAHIINKKLGPENCVLITGETKDKQQGIEDFRAPNKKYLIATDCLSYGVNIDFAHIIIHYDFPWNPAKLEQRTGRIDRLTQKVKNLLVINLIIDNSIEKHVIDILNQKDINSQIVMHGYKNIIVENLFKIIKKKYYIRGVN